MQYFVRFGLYKIYMEHRRGEYDDREPWKKALEAYDEGYWTFSNCPNPYPSAVSARIRRLAGVQNLELRLSRDEVVIDNLKEKGLVMPQTSRDLFRDMFSILGVFSVRQDRKADYVFGELFPDFNYRQRVSGSSLNRMFKRVLLSTGADVGAEWEEEVVPILDRPFSVALAMLFQPHRTIMYDLENDKNMPYESCRLRSVTNRKGKSGMEVRLLVPDNY